ncbi:MAG: hypothetical protein GY820_39690 [Gammaproteobacteria bacterium]|nr:hypothetical protein [Gammaproteobacteria bacterium]
MFEAEPADPSLREYHILTACEKGQEEKDWKHLLIERGHYEAAILESSDEWTDVAAFLFGDRRMETVSLGNIEITGDTRVLADEYQPYEP